VEFTIIETFYRQKKIRLGEALVKRRLLWPRKHMQQPK